MKLTLLRRIVQLSILAGLTAMGLLAVQWLPWFSRFSPLMTLSTRLAARQWTPYFFGGVIIFFLGAVFPRFFCGWICPVGTCIDMVDKITFAAKRNFFPAVVWPIAWTVDIALIAAASAQIDIAGYLDPLTFFSHTLTTVIPEKGVHSFQSAFVDTSSDST